MGKSQAILVVDDEERVVDLLSMYLMKEGYEVTAARDGEEALTLFESNAFDLVLLDLMLPKIEGLEVCRLIRQRSNTPVIMLTARDDDIDKILGLEMGADDYVTKPFNPREVVARVRAVMRRLVVSTPAQKLITFPYLEINLSEYKVTVDNREVAFTPKEIELLWFLASHPGQVFTREQLLEHIWGYDYLGDTRTVDTHVKRVRYKLSPEPHYPWEIKTVWGVGYKLELNRK